MEKTCEMCQKTFDSKIGEVYCPPCSKEFEEAGDISTLNDIMDRRGFKWLTEAIGETASCHNCGIVHPIKLMVGKKINEETSFREEPLSYPKAMFCRECAKNN